MVTVRLKIKTNQFMIFKEKFATCRYHVKDGKNVGKILVSDLTINSERIGRGMKSVPL